MFRGWQNYRPEYELPEYLDQLLKLMICEFLRRYVCHDAPFPRTDVLI